MAVGMRSLDLALGKCGSRPLLRCSGQCGAVGVPRIRDVGQGTRR